MDNELINQRDGVKVMTISQFDKTNALIARTSSYKELTAIANNILRQLMADKCGVEFWELYNEASYKAKVARIIERCPAPVSYDNKEMSALETLAFNRCVEQAAKRDLMPSIRVITNQISKLGYALTAAKQVTNKVGGDGFVRMAKMGLVNETSEYFIYKHARNLVTPKVLAKVDALLSAHFGRAV